MTSFKEKSKYNIENFISKGGKSIFISLFFLFLIAFVFAVVFRWMLLGFSGSENIFHHAWITFLEMTDPGNMNQDNSSSTIIKISTILAGFLGVIIFSMLVAFIITNMEAVIYSFRKGKSKVFENDHTLILGWNERVVDIIKEIILANESEKYGCIVILAQKDKEEMDEIIDIQITDKKTTRIVTRHGNPSFMSDIVRINASHAKSAIVLASCSDNSTMDEKLDSDNKSIKVIMAMLACQDENNDIPIVAEIFSKQKRDIIKFFKKDNILAIDSWNILGKLLVQTSMTSGLEIVYSEILSFDGDEIYFYQADWDNITFGELPFHFQDGVPMGIHKSNGELIMRPDPETMMQNDDEIIILAEDDSTIKFRKQKLIEPIELEFADGKTEQTSKGILILGWHHIAKILINEYDDYLKDGSIINVIIKNPSQEIKDEIHDLKKNYENLNINLIESDALSYESLVEAAPYTYDNVIILSQNENDTPEKMDTDTLVILLLLRKILEEKGEVNANTKIITQILNSENQELIIQTDVDDFIISNKLITMILAQLSEELKLNKLYDDIFEEDGSEIYVKSCSLYMKNLPCDVRFADIMALANKREEICLGIRINSLSKSPENNFGVKLNLAKDEIVRLNENDYLVVLAADEL